MTKPKTTAPPDPESDPKSDSAKDKKPEPERWKIQPILPQDELTAIGAAKAFEAWSAYMWPIFRSGYVAASSDHARAHDKARAYMATYTTGTGAEEFTVAK